MASALINVALSSIRPPHASYYGDINEKNPVVHAANREIKEVIAYFHKKVSGAVKSDEACSRGSNWLFDVWNKYEPRLPVDLFYNKLVEVGDSLKELGVHDVASRQCYQRYLLTRYGEIPHAQMENAITYRKIFFGEKQDMKDHILTSKAILGMYVSDYHCIFSRDPNMLARESASQCLAILKSIRTFMQCLMAHESLCWMVYNCTIIIYQICRLFMTAGNSIKIVEFLLWAAMCMETVIPLLGVRYLNWRVTLYSAICLAYYDCKAGHHAEAFARRGLSKLQELSELERMSASTPTIETQNVFRQATTKMASMVFKRSVYETRRKPKGYLRPKVRNNLKDSAQMAWPRTVTEKLLSDMFEGSAAQFIGILEALSSSHRRTLHNGPASTDAEMVEVNSELFFAGKEIIAGGGGNRGFVASGADHSVLAGVQHSLSLMDMASAGMDGVTISSVVKFIKLAFCYDNRVVFNTLLDCALIYIKKSGEGFVKEGPAEHSGTELCLALLLLMERLTRNQPMKKVPLTTSVSVMPAAGEDEQGPPQTQGSTHSVQINDELVNLAETVLYCINEPSLFEPQALDGDILIDKDMILDASLMLWQKCKSVFGKLPSSARGDMASALQRSGEPGKWLHILTVVHSALVWCGIGAVDPILIAEVCLRLAVSLEAAASSDAFGSRYSEDIGEGSRLSIYSTTQVSPNNQLSGALQVLEDGLTSIAIGRSNMTSNDGQHVADISWMESTEQMAEISTSPSDAFIRDLHVEMLVVHHRISLRLMERNEQKPTAQSHHRGSRRNTSRANLVITEEKVKEKVGGSLVSRAIYLMEKADLLTPHDPKAEKLLQRAVTSIENAQQEEKRLFEDSWLKLNNPYYADEDSDVPPPPILLSRSDTFMTFKPAPFNPESAKVAWYRVFGRLSAGPNVKVRLNDYFLPGAGDEVPAGEDCILRVDGLSPNQRYVFAVAAYTSDGKLIGGSVGKTGHSVVACHPMSIMAVWGHLAQVSYKLGCLRVSKIACSVLWNNFVAPPSEAPSETWTSTSRKDFSLSLHHLNVDVARNSSPVLLRHALTSVFVAVETAVYDKEIFCDKMSEKGPLLASQIARLQECERMLVAIEIAGWLNDASSVLQAVVQTYGLICPIIQAEIIALPVMQVATRCHSALQEIRNVLKMKRSNAASDSLNHMIAVLTNYISNFSKVRGKTQAALAAIEAGKQLLKGESVPVMLNRKVSVEQSSGSSKRSRSRKGATSEGAAERSPATNLELAALEERLSDLTRESRASDEMMGTEEPNVVIARLTKMRPLVAFRELSKFRRRTRFLEFFVIVLRKALKFQQVEVAIEWSQDVLGSLHRRNDTLAVNRAVVSKQPGGVAVQGDETRKYAAAIAEYSQEPKKNRREEAIRSKQREKQKKFTMLKRSAGGASNEEQEEAERKAMYTLSIHLLKCYRNYMKKRKMRKLVADELVWRAEFNLLNALLHYQVFLEKLKDRSITRGIKTPKFGTYEFLDHDWWSYETSGAVVVGWDEGTRPSTEPKPDYRDHSDCKKALDKAAYLAVWSTLVADGKPRSPLLDDTARPESPKTIRTGSTMSHHTAEAELASSSQADSFLHSLKVTMLCFQRGMVLAYRGKFWTMLQNIASALYSSVMLAMQLACDSTESAFSLKKLREIVRLPITVAADLLMDMLVNHQDGLPDGDWLYKSFMGEIKDEKGGLSLKFDEPIDDAVTVNVLLIKKIVLHAIQILHFETRYEKLVDIGLKFSELTHDRFCDVITPLVVHAQARIKERVKEYGGEPHPQQHIVHAAEELGRNTVEVRDYLRYNMKISNGGDTSSIGVGGFIDPASHDVYGGGRRAFALSCVPFDPSSSMERLRVAFSQTQYMSRALQHSRRLLVIYLASQHNSVERVRKQSARTESASGSCVEFSIKADEPHATAPPDITEFDFTSKDVVEVLASPQISTVLESYNRTLELLESHGERGLVSQASNELANLYYHQGNVKAAHKWWSHALDQILPTKDSLRNWKRLIKDEDNIPEELLAITGIWGCLLALSLTCKIGEFTAPNTEMKGDCALLSASLVRAIFRSSMPHPTADCDYASYEIVPTSVQQALLLQSKSRNPSLPGTVQSGTLLNGVDLFSDRFRCDLHTLVASLHWLCEYLVSTRFCLQALPALTLYQYVATFVCRDTQRSVQCRCLKLTALTELRMFKEASEDVLNLLHGIKLPHQTDVAYAPSDPLPLTVLFDAKKSIEDTDNLKVLEVIASKRLSGSLSFIYGPHLTCEVTLCQANLLAQMAGCISCIPQKPTVQDLQFISPDIERAARKSSTPQPYQAAALRGKRRLSSVMPDDARSTLSALSSSSSSRNVNKLFTKRERPMGLQLLKGMLLAVAENLASNMIKALDSSSEELVASELWFFVKSLCLMSEIQQQRQLSTLSAAKAMNALRLLRDSDLFRDEPSEKPSKLRSAMRVKLVVNYDTSLSSAKSMEPYPVLEQMYRVRLNSRLWLDCRLRLCQALATQVKGLGKVESALSDKTGLLDHSQVQLYCAEGLAEAEACNDIEMQALFLVQGATLDGISSNESKHMLEDAASSLDDQEELSCRAVISLVESTTMMADLCLPGGTASEVMQMYKSAQSVLLLKMMQEGETIQHFQAGGELSSLGEKPKNLYSSNLQLLARIKLRIAHITSQMLASDRIGTEHGTIAKVLSQAKRLSSMSAIADLQLLAEIKLELGKIQRLLYSAGIGQIKSVHSCLQEAIEISLDEVSDLSMVRNAYLEMAMLDLMNIERKFSDNSLISLELDRSSSSPSLKGTTSLHESGVRSFSMDVGIVSQPLELTQGKGRVVQSLYSAYHAACGLRKRTVLPGSTQVTSLTFTSDDKTALPDFILVDLSSDHSDLPPSDPSSEDVTHDPVLSSVRLNSTGLSWIHVFMYNVLLQRKSRLSTAISNNTSIDEEEPARSLEGSEESMSQAITKCVRTPLKSTDVHLRMSALHMYLKRHTAYAATCVSPPTPKSKSFIAAQWYRAVNVEFLWAISRSDGTVDCGRVMVNSQELDNVAQQVVDLKKRTDEFFGRSANQQQTSQTQRRRTKPKIFAIDSQLEEDWKHVVNQMTNLLASQDEPISELPFDVTIASSKSVVDIFSVGCCFENSHPLHSWMSDMLCPC